MEVRRLKVQTENQWFQLAETLKRNRRKRHQQQQFLVEGVRAINGLTEAGNWSVEAFLFKRQDTLSNWAKQILEKNDCPWHLELSSELMAKLSDREDTSELLAIVNMQKITLADLPTSKDALIVLSDRPASPGNLGTLIRSCDALGAHGLLVSGHAADLYDPQALRASAGTFFNVPTLQIHDPLDFVAWIENVRHTLPSLQIVGTSEQDASPVAACDFTRPTLLIIGNEARGMSRRNHELCDCIVSIPTTGKTQSLNMACAGTVVLYEIQSQRLAGSSGKEEAS
jgi:tRNA G18 (ribose-2'-O)-methylase SpoU